LQCDLALLAMITWQRILSTKHIQESYTLQATVNNDGLSNLKQSKNARSEDLHVLKQPHQLGTECSDTNSTHLCTEARKVVLGLQRRRSQLHALIVKSENVYHTLFSYYAHTCEGVNVVVSLWSSCFLGNTMEEGTHLQTPKSVSELQKACEQLILWIRL
ncbi:hypothetical protein STEG23_006935, partial [Scotinomys teguina]